MLKNRILSTLKFFDLQDYPLTLLELRRFLIAPKENLSLQIDGSGEIIATNLSPDPIAPVLADEILKCLENDCQAEVKNIFGFYYLNGRENLVKQRLENYYFGINREKQINRFIKGLRHLPFVRGVALAGSQAMGQQKETSDIDLFIVVCPGYMWLARTLITGYFQVLGKRRYGQYIANRFCLNHYIMGPKEITNLKNLYTASEYLKLRPLIYEHSIWQFQKINEQWLKIFFPNFALTEPAAGKQSLVQKAFEYLLDNSFGRWINEVLKNWQLPKIRTEKFIVVEEDELSFHPESKQQRLLSDFNKFQKQEQRVAEELVV
ncbi:MAG: nucleotidyltransferase domain-containing protein [Candidatus Doudnabacteria bacterium]|nr:nucleotidyltransferase domain-containing protein [Candidatus Doudnabacteria bacterium]